MTDINVSHSSWSGDGQCFLTFADGAVAQQCMDVVYQWWVPYRTNQWKFCRVKWLQESGGGKGEGKGKVKGTGSGSSRDFRERERQ